MTENSIQILPIDKVKINPKNPRTITDEAFKKLVKSIKDFPDMLNKRPIIVNDKMIILGGNKRYEAAVEAGLKEIPVIVTNWNKKQQQEFLIKDNISFGEWDISQLELSFDNKTIIEWGVDKDYFITERLETKGKTPAERLEVYNTNVIRQIVLYYTHQEYEDVILRIEKIEKSLNSDNNSDTFIKLIDFYERNRKG